MSDSLTPEKRSWNMSQIPAQDTSIEVKVRKYLFAQGFRYRKNVKGLPGKPDIVLPKYRTVVFIHGCFWHRHENCKRATTPKSRLDYWLPKFDRNVQNDRKHREELEEAGWNVVTIWECEVNKSFDETMEKLTSSIQNNASNSATTKKEE